MKQGMSFMRGILVIMVVFSFLLVLLMGRAEAGPDVFRVTLGTTSASSGMYPWLCAHAIEVNKRMKDIQITAIESPNSTIENGIRIYKGEMQMGWGGGSQTYRAFHGIGEFKGMANPDLRMAAYVAEVPFTFFAIKESGVKSLKELDGKKFGTGFPASQTGEISRRLFETMGIKPKFFEAALGANIEAVKNRSIVGFAKTGAPDSSILDIAAFQPINILGLTKEDFVKFEAKYPDYAESFSFIPARAYPGQLEDIPTLCAPVGWQTTAKLPTDVVYKIVKAWYEARKDLAAMYAAANKERGELGFPKLTLEIEKIPLHAGACKFYKELGLSIPTKLIPPEAK